jgi:GT2 family glycosyltransferase
MPKDISIASLSIVMISWNRPYIEAENALLSLRNQTVQPAEIIMVDCNVKQDMNLLTLCEEYGTRVLWHPMETFSLAKGFNYGIKRTLETSHFVLTTCPEMLFGKRVIEKVMQLASDATIVLAPCGFLPASVKIQSAKQVMESHLDLSMRVAPYPPELVSGGTIICISRSWWHSVRGYDITRPFNYTDSVVSHRATMSGLVEVAIKWDDVCSRILHPYHDISPLYYSLGGGWPNPYETNPVRNDENWGN